MEAGSFDGRVVRRLAPLIFALSSAEERATFLT
jgi:hypothetical protein